MKPMGTIPYFLAAVRSLLRARSLAASPSKATWLKRARAFRTCDSSLIGSRRRPRESTYAKALLGSCARFLVLSWLIAIRFACRRYLTRRHGATGHWVNLLRHTSLRAGRQPSTYTHVRLGLPARSRLVWLATCPSACAQTHPLPTWARPCGARHASTTIAARRCHETIHG